MLAVMSIGFLLEHKDDAVIWRGPKKNGMAAKRNFAFKIGPFSYDKAILIRCHVGRFGLPDN